MLNYSSAACAAIAGTCLLVAHARVVVVVVVGGIGRARVLDMAHARVVVVVVVGGIGRASVLDSSGREIARAVLNYSSCAALAGTCLR